MMLDFLRRRESLMGNVKSLWNQMKGVHTDLNWLFGAQKKDSSSIEGVNASLGRLWRAHHRRSERIEELERQVKELVHRSMLGGPPPAEEEN